MTEGTTTDAGAAESAAAATTAGTTSQAAEASTTAAASAETPREQTVPLSRLQAVIGQKAEAERAREALARELRLANDTLEEFRALGSKTGEQTPEQKAAAERARANGKALSPEELRQLVAQEAEKQNFDKQCNAAVVAGRKEHADFDKVVLGDLMSVSPVVDQQNGRPVLPVPLLEAAIETGNAHEVLYALGQDVNEASKIMALRPVAQAVELAKFAAKLVAARTQAEPDTEPEPDVKVSRAPAPIKAPSKGGAARPAWKPEDTDNFSTEEWIRNRQKQVDAERAGSRR
jgi:hypothetical protein